MSVEYLDITSIGSQVTERLVVRVRRDPVTVRIVWYETVCLDRSAEGMEYYIRNRLFEAGADLRFGRIEVAQTGVSDVLDATWYP